MLLNGNPEEKKTQSRYAVKWALKFACKFKLIYSSKKETGYFCWFFMFLHLVIVVARKLDYRLERKRKVHYHGWGGHGGYLMSMWWI
jgi:hypothetical protein